MQLLELMERIGNTNTNLIAAYVRDAFREIQGLAPENKSIEHLDIVSGKEEYYFPDNMVKLIAISINDNGIESYNTYRWRWINLGHKFKLYRLGIDNELIVPDIDVTDGIEILCTVSDYVFVKDPAGDSSYYDYTTEETAEVATGEIVFNTGNIWPEKGIKGHYYKRVNSSLSSTDLSTVDYTDTDYWQDVTEIEAPDEMAFINCDDDVIDVVEQYVRAKLADAEGNIDLYEYRNIRLLRKLERTIRNRMPELRVKPPRRPFKLK